jgi:hypothetical protein
VEVDRVEVVLQNLQNVIVASEKAKVLKQVHLEYNLVDVVEVASRQRPEGNPLTPLHVHLEGYMLACQLMSVYDVFKGI